MRVAIVALLLAACGPGSPADTGDAATEAEALVPLGTMAAAQLLDGSRMDGVAARVRRADGTEAPALFRGPMKLGEHMSNGTWIFDAAETSPRVRILEPGERLLERR